MAGSEECGDVSCGEGWPPAVELTVEHHEDLERCSGEKSALSSACRVIETWCTLQIRAKSLQSCLTLSAISWIVALHSPPSMGFSRQEYWSGLPFPPPGDLPDPGIEPASPVAPELQADCLLLNHQGSPADKQVSLLKSLSFFVLNMLGWGIFLGVPFPLCIKQSSGSA